MEDEGVKIEPVMPEIGEGEQPQAPVAGEKTDSALLLKSLQEEREKRREAEAEKLRLEEQLLAKNTLDDDDVFSDEGKALQHQIVSLNEKLELREVGEKYPVLKDKVSEFNEFRKNYPNIGMEKIAKLFLSENDLTETVTVRKGLEPVSGGSRQAPQTGMSSDEVSNLRNTNFRKYSQMVREGKIKV